MHSFTNLSNQDVKEILDNLRDMGGVEVLHQKFERFLWSIFDVFMTGESLG